MKDEIQRLKHFFPRFLLEDTNGYALACAIMAGLDAVKEEIEAGVSAVLDIGQMPEWRLDEMAWELNVQWYDYGADLNTKRSQISGVQRFYRRLGTPYAVERTISDVFDSGRVEEWFEYGGSPYTFRIYTTDATAMNEKRREFLKMLNTVKNVRSRLENIYYYGSSARAESALGAQTTGAYIAVHATARNYKEDKNVQ